MIQKNRAFWPDFCGLWKLFDVDDDIFKHLVSGGGLHDDVTDTQVLSVSGDDAAVGAGIVVALLGGEIGVFKIDTVYLKMFVVMTAFWHRVKIFHIAFDNLVVTLLIGNDDFIVLIYLIHQDESTDKGRNCDEYDHCCPGKSFGV